jgi:hypothetical protein
MLELSFFLTTQLKQVNPSTNNSKMFALSKACFSTVISVAASVPFFLLLPSFLSFFFSLSLSLLHFRRRFRPFKRPSKYLSSSTLKQAATATIIYLGSQWDAASQPTSTVEYIQLGVCSCHSADEATAIIPLAAGSVESWEKNLHRRRAIAEIMT